MQLAQWQQERILRNHVLDFPEFREITIFGADGRVVATSRAAATRLEPPGAVSFDNGVHIASPRLDEDELPTTTMSLVLGHAVGAARLDRRRDRPRGAVADDRPDPGRRDAATRCCSTRTAASSRTATTTRSGWWRGPPPKRPNSGWRRTSAAPAATPAPRG